MRHAKSGDPVTKLDNVLWVRNSDEQSDTQLETHLGVSAILITPTFLH